MYYAEETGLPAWRTTRDSRSRRSATRRACTRRGGTAPTMPVKFAAIYDCCASAAPADERRAIRRAHRARARRQHPLRGDRHHPGRDRARAKGSHGFGYDPIFFYPPYDCTLAEVDWCEKAAVSHRGKAFGELREYLIGSVGSSGPRLSMLAGAQSQLALARRSAPPSIRRSHRSNPPPPARPTHSRNEHEDSCACGYSAQCRRPQPCRPSNPASARRNVADSASRTTGPGGRRALGFYSQMRPSDDRHFGCLVPLTSSKGLRRPRRFVERTRHPVHRTPAIPGTFDSKDDCSPDGRGSGTVAFRAKCRVRVRRCARPISPFVADDS